MKKKNEYFIEESIFVTYHCKYAGKWFKWLIIKCKCSDKGSNNGITKCDRAGNGVIESEKADYKLKITAQLEKEGWYSDKANVKVRVEKIYGNSKFKIEKVEAKIGSTGAWIDITDDMSFEIQENCTTYIKVTDVYGAEFEKARSFKCFDTVAPTLNAAVNEGLLNIMTYDTESGVKEVYVNEYSFVPDQNGVITVKTSKV